jgi:hypothetical protein
MYNNDVSPDKLMYQVIEEANILMNNLVSNGIAIPKNYNYPYLAMLIIVMSTGIMFCKDVAMYYFYRINDNYDGLRKYGLICMCSILGINIIFYEQNAIFTFTKFITAKTLRIPSFILNKHEEFVSKKLLSMIEDGMNITPDTLANIVLEAEEKKAK